MKCLWVVRELPFPMDAGDRTYSGTLAQSLAETGAVVRMIGHATGTGARIPSNWPVDWKCVEGQRGSWLSGAIGPLPMNAAIHGTNRFKALLRSELLQSWDAVVIDSYGSGWALDICARARREGKDFLLVYVSHNHEETLWHAMARSATGSFFKRAVIMQNALKVQRLERNLVRSADLITAITPQDADLYSKRAGAKPICILSPGYSGKIASPRSISAATPRRVVLLGSFRWIVKQQNLRRFLSIADRHLHRAGITLDIIGDVPDSLRRELSAEFTSCLFHGFVEDVSPFFANARLAVVPEQVGGGFKLKLLDYIFARVPVVSLKEATSGLPSSITDHLVLAADLDHLVAAIVDQVDNIDRLNDCQERSFEAARSAYRWRDRGVKFRRAMEQMLD